MPAVLYIKRIVLSCVVSNNLPKSQFMFINWSKSSYLMLHNWLKNWMIKKIISLFICQKSYIVITFLYDFKRVMTEWFVELWEGLLHRAQLTQFASTGNADKNKTSTFSASLHARFSCVNQYRTCENHLRERERATTFPTGSIVRCHRHKSDFFFSNFIKKKNAKRVSGVGGDLLS